VLLDGAGKEESMLRPAKRLNSVSIISILGLGAAGILALLGAILPWAQAPFGISKAGVEGDGILTLLAGMLLITIAVVRFAKPAISAWAWTAICGGFLLAGFILVTAVIDINSVQDAAKNAEGLIRVGSGLYLTALAGGLGMAGAVVGIFDI
jgi:hypothetical protein